MMPNVSRCDAFPDATIFVRPIYQSYCPNCEGNNIALDDTRLVVCRHCKTVYESPGFVGRQVGNVLKGVAFIAILAGWILIIGLCVWAIVTWLANGGRSVAEDRKHDF